MGCGASSPKPDAAAVPPATQRPTEKQAFTTQKSSAGDIKLAKEEGSSTQQQERTASAKGLVSQQSATTFDAPMQITLDSAATNIQKRVRGNTERSRRVTQDADGAACAGDAPAAAPPS